MLQQHVTKRTGQRSRWHALCRFKPLEGTRVPLPKGSRRSGEREAPMCLDCGCGEPNERHGDDRHIIMDDIQAAATASEIPMAEATRNIVEALSQTPPSAASAE